MIRRLWSILLDERGHFDFSSKSEKSGGTQTTAIPEASASEKELQALNLELAKRQLASLTQADQQASEYASSPQAALDKQLQQVGEQKLLDRLTGKATLSPEDQARLDTIYGNAQTQGEDDLMRFARDLAASRGMTVADSPIGGEVLAQRQKLGSNLQAAKAGAALDLGNASGMFQQQVADFARQLQDRAFQSRLAIAGMTPAPFALQSSLFQQRAAGAPRSFTGFGNTNAYGLGLSGADVYGYGKGFSNG